MAQSALSVTTSNPTPPTNQACTGATPPNVPNYQRQSYANPFNLDANGRPQSPYGVNPNPPPYFDDGAAGALHTFATNTAALTGGVSANDTGTGTTISTAATGAGGSGANSAVGTYPGVTSGLVPASSSAAHEGAGTETRVLAPGNISHTYVVGTLDMSQSVSTGPVATQATRDAGPNSAHASSDTATPASAPTITGLLPVAPVSNAAGNTTTLTVNGTNFKNGAVVNIGGVPYPTQYNSATQLKVLNAPMRTSAGNTAITVRVGATTTAGTNWIFS